MIEFIGRYLVMGLMAFAMLFIGALVVGGILQWKGLLQQGKENIENDTENELGVSSDERLTLEDVTIALAIWPITVAWGAKVLTQGFSKTIRDNQKIANNEEEP